MEPRKEPEAAKVPEQEGKEKKRRFQIVRLEERIAPGQGSKGTHKCGGSGNCTEMGCGVSYY
jgi:hypothetical protein